MNEPKSRFTDNASECSFSRRFAPENMLELKSYVYKFGTCKVVFLVLTDMARLFEERSLP